MLEAFAIAWIILAGNGITPTNAGDHFHGGSAARLLAPAAWLRLVQTGPLTVDQIIISMDSSLIKSVMRWTCYYGYHVVTATNSAALAIGSYRFGIRLT